MKKTWETKTLREVLRQTATVNPLQSPETEFDYVDVSSVSNTSFQIESPQRLKGRDAPSRARRVMRSNDVLFATIRPTLQRIAVVPEALDNQVCSTGYIVLRPTAALHYRFLFYWLFTDGFVSQMESLQKGTSYPAVSDGDVRAQLIPLPPLADQRRIVAILDEAFEGIATANANAERNLANARAVYDSHLKSVFSNHEPGWRDLRLNQVSSDLGRGKSKHRPRNDPRLYGGKYPLNLPRSRGQFHYAAIFSNCLLMNFNSNSIGLT